MSHKQEQRPEQKKHTEQEQKTEQKRKPKYGMLSCVIYMYRLLWESRKMLVWAGILYVPMSLATAALELYIPAVVLHFLEKSNRFSEIALIILGLMLARFLVELGFIIMETKRAMDEFYMTKWMLCQSKCYALDRDPYLNYDPEIRELDNRADQATMNNQTKAIHFPVNVSNIVTLVLQFILFGSVISVLSPWIILLLVLGSLLNMPVCMDEKN